MAKEIIVKQGESRTLIITVKSSTGSPVNLSSASFWLGIKQSPGDTAYIVLKNSIYFDYTDAADGQVSVSLDSNDTVLDVGSYWMEIKVSFSNGRVQRTLADYFLKIKQSVVAPKLVSLDGSVAVEATISGAATT